MATERLFLVQLEETAVRGKRARVTLKGRSASSKSARNENARHTSARHKSARIVQGTLRACGRCQGLTDWHLGAACWLHKRPERCRKLAAWESTLRDLCSTSCQVPVLLCSGSSPALSRNSRVSSWLSNHMACASSATGRVSGFALGPAATRL